MYFQFDTLSLGKMVAILYTPTLVFSARLLQLVCVRTRLAHVLRRLAVSILSPGRFVTAGSAEEELGKDAPEGLPEHQVDAAVQREVDVVEELEQALEQKLGHGRAVSEQLSEKEPEPDDVAWSVKRDKGDGHSSQHDSEAPVRRGAEVFHVTRLT